MCKNTETCIIEAGENAEEVISAIQEKKAQNKTIILNLFKTENAQVQKDIINFINENYHEFTHRIAEKVYIISLKITEQNVVEGDFWK